MLVCPSKISLTFRPQTLHYALSIVTVVSALPVSERRSLTLLYAGF